MVRSISGTATMKVLLTLPSDMEQPAIYLQSATGMDSKNMFLKNDTVVQRLANFCIWNNDN
jgi:hypothetical protein